MRKIKVIAEFGVNHNGSLERAKEGIKAAAEAGADCIKFQTYTADELVVKGTPKFWKSEGGDVGKDQYEAYKALGGFPYEHYPELMAYCDELGIEFMSTPFSFEAADKLNAIGMKAFKVASSDMSCLPFLRHIAKFDKPIYLSTGASTLDEIYEAVHAIRSVGNNKVVILHCTLCYPTKAEDANLAVIQTLKQVFPGTTIGVSDHTIGADSAIIAAAMGADVIEKHFTVDKTLPDSADHWFSVDPEELKVLVAGCRMVETLSGSPEKRILDCEVQTRQLDKRSIVSKNDIAKGDKIRLEDVTYKRPGTGIWPKFVDQVVGKEALIDIPADTILSWSTLG